MYNTIKKIKIGSLISNLNQRRILGKQSIDSIYLLMVLEKQLEYVVSQYNSGNFNYQESVNILKKKIFTLRNKCNNICDYKNKNIILN